LKGVPKRRERQRTFQWKTSGRKIVGEQERGEGYFFDGNIGAASRLIIASPRKALKGKEKTKRPQTNRAPEEGKRKEALPRLSWGSFNHKSFLG